MTKRIVSAALVAAAAIAIPAGGTAQALVGGQEADSVYPFVASLQLDGVHHCGAT